jgi:hypothetical protein
MDAEGAFLHGNRETAPGRSLARLGAVCYAVWAILHLQAAWSVYGLGHSTGFSMEQGRLLQDAWNLAAFSFFGFCVAVRLNWRNDVWGYWINLGIISVADLGFIFFVLIPGHIPLWPGIAGPALWLAGLVSTTIGRTQAK